MLESEQCLFELPLSEVEGLKEVTQETVDRIHHLEAALRWYVENDEVNEGGHWEEVNSFWLAGKRRAMKLLGMKV